MEPISEYVKKKLSSILLLNLEYEMTFILQGEEIVGDCVSFERMGPHRWVTDTCKCQCDLCKGRGRYVSGKTFKVRI